LQASGENCIDYAENNDSDTMVNEAQNLAERCAAAMLKRDSASRGLGMTVQSVAPGQAVLQMKVRNDMANGHGICHGGFVFLLADSAFAFACNSYDKLTVAASADISFVNPVKTGELLTATAQEVFLRGRSGVYDIRVTREDGETVALFRGKSRTLNDTVLQHGD
jgi:acyl-CoA thioesterase